jgi:hypothetical protein
MAPPDEKPPINPVPPPLTQRERLEREQAEMAERLKHKPTYPMAVSDGGWDWHAIATLAACTIAGAVMLGLIVYYFLF